MLLGKAMLLAKESRPNDSMEYDRFFYDEIVNLHEYYLDFCLFFSLRSIKKNVMNFNNVILHIFIYTLILSVLLMHTTAPYGRTLACSVSAGTATLL
jgi:hypothetical protein